MGLTSQPVASRLIALITAISLFGCDRNAPPTASPAAPIVPAPASQQSADEGQPPADVVSEDPSANSPAPLAPAKPLPETVPALVDECRGVMDRLVEEFPANPDAWEVRGRHLYQVGKNAEAKESWRKCLELAPGYVYAQHGLGMVAVREGDDEKAVELFRKALAAAPELKDTVHELHRALVRLGRPEEAIDALRKYIGQNPESTDTWIYLGQTYLTNGQYEEARQAFETANSQYPGVARTELGLGTALLRLGRREAAKTWLEKHQASRDRANALERVERLDEDDLDARMREFAFTLTTAARVYLSQGDMREGERILRRAAAFDEQREDCRQLLFEVYQQLGHGDLALKTGRELLEIAPENPNYWLTHGTLAAVLGEYQTADESFRQVIRLAPQHAAGYSALAKLALQTESVTAESIDFARRAVETSPSAENHMVLAQTLAAVGNWDGARAAVERAIEADPSNAAYRQLLQQIEQRKG
ncbi:MAG: tetratricopeptide repeat protein [Planctomycetes bacterium]|nr:tetratricopeptide repeat protein [Planctomycetota bacterium]